MQRGAAITRAVGRVGGGLLFVPLVYLAVGAVAGGNLPGFGPEGEGASVGAGAGALVGRSLLLALVGALVACVLGGGAALVFERRRFPLASFWRATALAALVCPPVFQVAVWERLAVPDGVLATLFPFATADGSPFPIRNLGFACWLLGLSYSPVFFLLVGTGLRSLPTELLEAASLHRAGATVGRRIVLPLVAPWLVAAFGVSFPLLFLNYEVPRLLDVYTYPVLIHVEYGAKSDPGAAFAAAVPALLLTLLVLLPCMRWAQRRGFALSGRESGRVLVRAGVRVPGIGAWLLFACWWLLVTALPMGILARIAGGADAFHRAWLTDWERVGWSALVTGTTALAAVSLAGLLLWSRGRRGGHVGVGYWILLALPGSLLAFALVALCQRDPLFSLYDSWGILVVAGVLRFFPLAYYSLAFHLRTIPQPLWEAASLGPSRLARWSRVQLPLLAPGLVAGGIVVALFASQEISAAVLLAPPGQEPLIVRIYNLLHYDPERDVLAALALLQIGAVLAVIGCFAGVGRLITAAPKKER